MSAAVVDTRIGPRFVAVAAACLGLALAALTRGTGWDPLPETLRALVGLGDGVVVQQWRAPRVVAGLLFGAALGLAGAIFQSLSRNALGSPDIIGLDAGAHVGALVAIGVVGSSALPVAAGGVLGGLAAAGLVLLLSAGTGVHGHRLVITGIAVNATLTAVGSWIMLRSDLDVAMAAAGWSAGSLNGLGWDDVLPPVGLLLGLFLALACLAHALHQTSVGDALATTTGVDLGRLRIALVVVGVGLTATVTATCGPVAFVALTAPQVGRRLTGAAGVALVPAALTGAALLVGADLLSQVLLAPVPLPVGVVTAALGGTYLMWLLGREMRNR